MEKIGEEFLQCWNEFSDAVLEKIPQPRGCEDAVLIVMKDTTGCLFKLDKDQVDKVVLLGTIRKLIEDRIGADEAISAALTEESVDILRQVTALIR